MRRLRDMGSTVVSASTMNTFVECWIHTDDVLDLVINFELQWVHRRGEVDLETAISHEMGEFNQWYH